MPKKNKESFLILNFIHDAEGLCCYMKTFDGYNRLIEEGAVPSLLDQVLSTAARDFDPAVTHLNVTTSTKQLRAQIKNRIENAGFSSFTV